MHLHASSLLLLLALAGIDGCGARRAERAAMRGDDGDTIEVGGRERSYVVRVPDAVARGSARVPLVIVLHGGGGNALNAEAMTGFTAKAKAEGFIVAYPDGSGRRRDALLTWNAGHCCGYAMEQKVDDVGFIGALIDELASRYPIDRDRVYVTGMSNGAMMTHRVGIELSDRIAAIAPVVGAVFGDERRPRAPVSALMINGLVDESIPFGGGAPGGRFPQAWDGTPTKPALDQARFWASADGCDATPTTVDRGRYTETRYDCPSSRDVELLAIADNPHAWPGGKPGSRMGATPSTAIAATDVIWSFFASHPRR